MKLLWLGALHSNYALWHRKNANPAAAKWTNGLIGGLQSNGAEVVGVTHCYDRLFPRGDLFPGRSEDYDAGLCVHAIRYPNVLGIKNRFLCRAYRRQVARLLDRENFDGVLCYNTVHPYHVAAMRLVAERGVPNVPIILDAADPRQDGWASILAQTASATGVVFLSNWAATHYPGRCPALHLDGGAVEWRGDDASIKVDPQLIVYTGGLDYYRGVAFLAAVMRLLPQKEWRFLLCGKTGQAQVLRQFSSDPRVEIKGFVSEEELHAISCRANVFISMRPPHVADNIMNFPSKIPSYLAYGKPVVSTWIDSFSPDYRQHLSLAEGDTPRDFAVAVERVMGWDDERRAAHRDALRDWFVTNKLWARQASRLLEWMRGICHA